MHPQTTAQVTGQVGEELRRIPAVRRKEMSWQEIQAALALRKHENFEAHYLKPALASASPPRAVPFLKLSISPRENILTSLSLSDIFPLNHAIAAKRGGGYITLKSL
jgi:hypothetical protein